MYHIECKYGSKTYSGSYQTVKGMVSVWSEYGSEQAQAMGRNDERLAIMMLRGIIQKAAIRGVLK